MTDPAIAVALGVAAYLIGGIPFGLILARRFAKVDVQKAGSGNIGATNVARTAGRTLGALTLVLDALKGVAPVLAAKALDMSSETIAAVGFGAVLGHVFSPYLRLRGGKGVATSAGVFMSVSPVSTGVAVGVFALVFLVSKRVSAGSVAAAVALIGSAWKLDGRIEIVALAGAIAAIVLVRHRSNLARLLRGKELGV
ncbi:MAG: glycerol-3-phosphate 1-O-acyltransferase PlsY [Deltaproteobacteria bacterium]|nr:glycerol-3-phosphate 1-O-acyltransferase PlsY [Deltaproteobacteria bacterium]